MNVEKELARLPALTADELWALTITAEGWTQTVAGRRYGRSTRTYRRRLNSAMRKLNARSPVHAAALAAARGLIHVQEIPHV